jgi:hypothetical protein
MAIEEIENFISPDVRGKINSNFTQLQEQLDTLVLEGDSSPEAAQARIDSEGNTYATLKQRLDNENIVLKEEVEAARTEDISNSRIKGLSVNQIDKNKGKLDQTYMADEFLQQMAGTTPINVTPADNSITEKKLAFPAVVGSRSRNLFNESTASLNKYINGETGILFDLEDYFVSDWIVVTAGLPYAIQPLSLQPRMSFYTQEKVYISSETNVTVANAPANAYYARIAHHMSHISTAQFEQASTKSPYEKYGVFLNEQYIRERTIPADRIQAGAITQTELAFAAVEGVKSKNIFDKESITNDVYIDSNNGSLFSIAGYFSSDLIVVEPNATYALTANDGYKRVAYYTAEGSYISVVDGADTFVVPAEAYYIRFASAVSDLPIAQIEKGDTKTSYESFGVKFDRNSLDLPPKPIYTFNDAWVNWLDGQKFPVAFWGNSTVDGVGTSNHTENLTPGVDHQPPNAFSMKLQDKIRNLTNNNTMRIYNAGHSGMTAIWGLANIEAEFAGASAYNDVKMVGIGWGINDRLQYPDEKAYRDGFKSNIISMVNWLYDHEIQPFLITTQATVEPGIGTTYSAYPMRTSHHIETIANEVKHDIAREYNLEIIDVNDFTERFMKYSAFSLQDIIADRLHFGNVGHEYEAGLMFAHIVPLTQLVTGSDKLDYSSQRVTDGIPSDLASYTTNDSDGFKVIANYTKANADDLKIGEFWIFVDSDRKLNLTAYKSDAASLTYVKVDGVTTALNTLIKNIGDLDLGLHRLEVFTGLSNKVDFKGFKLT